MKKLFLNLIFIQLTLSSYGQIIANHTVVDQFDKIPQSYINKVKTMWMSYPGESHSEAIRRGLELLEAAYPAYQVEVAEYTSPAPYTTAYLRADANTWGDVDHVTGWIRWYGEEDWYTSAAAIARTKAGITYCNTTGPALSAIGFGLCYGDGGGNYIAATQSYIDHCSANGYPTKVFFTTGPVDVDLHAHEWFVNYQAIRAYVAANTTRILFDFADILCYNNNGTGPNTIVDESFTIPHITEESASPDVGGFHFSNAGALRLAKAMWWMLARMAGWDGVTAAIPVTNITVTSPAGVTSVPVNSTLQLSALIFPSNATNKTITWSVTDSTGRASISPTGILSALATGNVVVRATADDGSQITGTLKITIIESTCPGDIDSNGDINTADLLSLLAKFGQPCTSGCPEDIDDSGEVNTNDLLQLLAKFGTTCQ
jgi:uncharacterized protein YjdB